MTLKVAERAEIDPFIVMDVMRAATSARRPARTSCIWKSANPVRVRRPAS